MQVPGSQNASVNVALTDLHHAFPFSLLIDRAGHIQHVGSSLPKLTSSSELVGKPVFEALIFKKPRRIDPSQLLQNVLNQRLTCELPGAPGEKPVVLYGTAFDVRVDGTPHVLLALTPGVNARFVVEERGLRLSDFGPVDGSADLLPLLAVQAEMLEDSKKKTTRLESARAEMERLANEDPLTGMPNRRALLRRLEKSIRDTPLSVIHIDLDRFKEINDTFGHAAGDLALRHAADGMRRACGDDALCARLGGDEFIVVLEYECSAAKLEDMAQKTIAQLSSPFTYGGQMLSVGASAGLAQSRPADGLTRDDLLHRADLALYEIKRSGRGGFLLCTPEILAASDSFQVLTADIRRGLAKHEIEAYFQPQVDIATGQVVGFEALARWHHPTRGLLTPGAFLPAIERACLNRQFDAEVRRSALGAFKLWAQNGIYLPKVSLNITTHDLMDGRFHETLSWELETQDLTPDRLTLEIVESVFFDGNSSQMLDACEALVHAGFELALDDFGTGHASILSLVHIPISIVKIDRAFVAGVAGDTRKQALTRSMIEMATNLNLRTLAEGVEQEDDKAVLQDMGCHMLQGYYLGKPMRLNDAMSWMKDWSDMTTPRVGWPKAGSA